MPRVSVIMPAFNAEAYIAEAVGSVLAQTYRDFELVVINDGSTDGTRDVIDEFDDPRIVRLDNERNLGLAQTRNRGIENSSGEFIAWLDSDDMAAPHRLQRQVELLSKRHDIGVCGSWVRTIEKRPQVWRYPSRPEVAKARLLFDNPLATSSVLLRRACLERIEGEPFRSEFAPAEDYDVWERLSAAGFGITSIPRVLTRYRIHEQQVTARQAERQRQAATHVQLRQLARLGIDPTSAQLALHVGYGLDWGTTLDNAQRRELANWLKTIENCNRQTRVLDQAALRSVFVQRAQKVTGQTRISPLRRLGQAYWAWRS